MHAPYRLLRRTQGDANPFGINLLSEYPKVEETKPKEQKGETSKVEESKLSV